LVYLVEERDEQNNQMTIGSLIDWTNQMNETNHINQTNGACQAFRGAVVRRPPEGRILPRR